MGRRKNQLRGDELEELKESSVNPAGNGVLPKYVPRVMSAIQQCMLTILSDGMPHTREELFGCVEDDMSDPISIKWHITVIRKYINRKGYNVEVDRINQRWLYRLVRMIASSSDYGQE